MKTYLTPEQLLQEAVDFFAAKGMENISKGDDAGLYHWHPTTFITCGGAQRIKTRETENFTDSRGKHHYDVFEFEHLYGASLDLAIVYRSNGSNNNASIRVSGINWIGNNGKSMMLDTKIYNRYSSKKRLAMLEEAYQKFIERQRSPRECFEQYLNQVNAIPGFTLEEVKE